MLYKIIAAKEEPRLIGLEIRSTSFFPSEPARQRIVTREEKEAAVENSVENALYETYIVSIQVYGYTYSLRAYSALHATPVVIKRENVSPRRCFNAMKTVSALPHGEKRMCLFQRVHFLVRTSRPKEISAMELKGLRATKTT